MRYATSHIRTSAALLHRVRFFLVSTLLVFALCIAGGCAHSPRAMNYAIASWQDQQVSEVIAAWGKPSEELNLEGKTLLIWTTYDGKIAPADTKRPSSQPTAGSCVRLLKADRKGRIVDGTWDGNDCPGWFSGWAR